MKVSGSYTVAGVSNERVSEGIMLCKLAGHTPRPSFPFRGASICSAKTHISNHKQLQA